MTINELMHNDLFMCGGGVCRFVIRTMDAIVQRLSDKNEYKPCAVLNAKPIPLTEEILKINGFEDGGGYMTRVVSGIIVEICLMHNIPMYVKAEWSFCFPHPQYVHELQHALRLCSLDEFADNFVIR